MIKGIDHIGIAVRSLSDAVTCYEKALGVRCERLEEVPSQKVLVAFFNVGGVHLELLQPSAPDSPIAQFIEKRGEGIHHVAFATSDISTQLDRAKGAGVKLIHETPFDGAAGKLVAFLHPKSTCGVLMEMCMPKPDAVAAH